ncbi:MAG: hypothetical protein CVT94_19205 [Bacteroidetes bacterium HGW-Bacteroidetes-11]|nr:MAG: hypothetical protein CVT94_19205 [Bacteroidetes bacterium HGW-Bacteroidetes-11]
MPEYFNHILCISKPELTDGDNPVITVSAYDKYVLRHPHVRLRRGSPAGPALLSWDLLRPDIREKYIQKCGDPKAIGPMYSLKNLIEPDYKAISFFAIYEIADNINLKPEKQQEYSANASVLNAINRVFNDRRALKKALGNKTKVSWSELAQAATELKEELHHSLPENPIRLKQRLEMYKSNGYVSLISGKFLNSNAARIVDPQQEATIRQLLRRHNNFDNQQIAEIYNTVAQSLGWDSITAPTVANYKKKWGLETFSGRRGESAFDNQKAMQVKRSAPTQPLYYWTADGWDVELLYQKTEIDNEGNSRTTYHNRLTMVVILDPSHKYPIGYAIGTHETPQLIKEAMRNAIVHTKELFGEHYKVLQLQTDNYSRKTLTPIYEAISKVFTPARVHNSKAKVIEPYFKYLNKRYCQFQPNWSGFGIKANAKSQPNDQYLNKIHNSFPDEFGCRLQINAIIEAERAKHSEKYIAAFRAMPEEDKHVIKFDEFLYMLGETTGYTNRLSGPGLLIKIDGVKHEYDTFDANFRRHADVDWVVKYEPGNTQRVLACSKDGTLRFELQERYVQPMALRDRQPGDSDELQQIKGFNKNLKGEIMESMERDYNEVSDLFENNPQLEGTLAKLILVDSNGQHKNNKSAARIGAARKVLDKQNKKAELAEARSWAQEQDEYLDSKIDISKFLNQ